MTPALVNSIDGMIAFDVIIETFDGLGEEDYVRLRKLQRLAIESGSEEAVRHTLAFVPALMREAGVDNNNITDSLDALASLVGFDQDNAPPAGLEVLRESVDALVRDVPY